MRPYDTTKLYRVMRQRRPSIVRPMLYALVVAYLLITLLSFLAR